jgi:hypothetical protein
VPAFPCSAIYESRLELTRLLYAEFAREVTGIFAQSAPHTAASSPYAEM